MKNANTQVLIGQALDQDLAAALARPVRIENDANCFALSEAADGAGAGHRCVFGVIIGTGCGGGVVVDGRVLPGRNRIAGEWGHTPAALAAPGRAAAAAAAGAASTGAWSFTSPAPAWPAAATPRPPQACRPGHGPATRPPSARSTATPTAWRAAWPSS